MPLMTQPPDTLHILLFWIVFSFCFSPHGTKWKGSVRVLCHLRKNHRWMFQTNILWECISELLHSYTWILLCKLVEDRILPCKLVEDRIVPCKLIEDRILPWKVVEDKIALKKIAEWERVEGVGLGKHAVGPPRGRFSLGCYSSFWDWTVTCWCHCWLAWCSQKLHEFQLLGYVLCVVHSPC